MNINKYIKKQKGVIILMFLVFLPFMLAFVGLAIDFGYIYVEKTKLQNAADAAALAGVVHLQDTDKVTNKKAFQIDEKKPVKDYVKAMLEGNSFKIQGDEPDGELSTVQNWKLQYLSTTKDNNGTLVTTEVTDPSDANRLRVTLFKTIPLIFIPVVVPSLAEIDLTSTAVAQGTLDGTKPSDEFQFIAMDTLRLGSMEDFLFGSVHIPSFPKDSVAKDLYNHNDFGKSLVKNVYASKIEFRPDSTMRASGKVLVTNSTTVNTKQLIMENPNNLESIADSKEYSITQIKNIVYTTKSVGKAIADDVIKDAIAVEKENNEIIEENNKEPDKNKHKPLKKTKAIVIKVTSEVFNVNDYSFYQIRNKNGEFFTGPDIDKPPDPKEPNKDQQGLDITVPVVFYSPTLDTFTLNFNVSWFCLTKELIVVGGNINISGSGSMDKPQYGTSFNKDYQKFEDIYCFSNEKGSRGTGEFIVASGSAATKNFNGIIYADQKINIQAMKDYRRHKFHDTLISGGEIEFGRDKSSFNGKDSACWFGSKSVSTKISLVE